jgi:hypothetical protein
VSDDGLIEVAKRWCLARGSSWTVVGKSSLKAMPAPWSCELQDTSPSIVNRASRPETTISNLVDRILEENLLLVGLSNYSFQIFKYDFDKTADRISSLVKKTAATVFSIDALEHHIFKALERASGLAAIYSNRFYLAQRKGSCSFA